MQQETLFPDTPFGKTSSGHCPATTVTTLRQSSGKWQTWGLITSNGVCLTHSSSESPKGVDACSSSLASILQPANEVDGKYSLSVKAAQGILRRAENRGKNLPERLRVALEQIANS